MDKSYQVLAGLQARIDRMSEDSKNVEFLRNVLVKIVEDREDTPVWVIGALAQTLVECRKIELKEIAEGN